MDFYSVVRPFPHSRMKIMPIISKIQSQNLMILGWYLPRLYSIKVSVIVIGQVLLGKF